MATIAAAALTIPVAVATSASATSSAGAHRDAPTAVAQPGHSVITRPGQLPSLPAPPRPPAKRPGQRAGYQPPTALLTSGRKTVTSGAAATTGSARPAHAHLSALTAPSQAVTWGSGSATTLVVYDTTGTWGYLGELYAMAGGNLASHFGQVTAEPVADYVAGQVNNYTATIYIGSTYNEPIPVAFLNDVLSTTHPVIWAGDNPWQLSGSEGSTADQAFIAQYGWDPSSSYFDTTDNPATISYNGQTFTRNAANGANVLAPHIITASAVTVLAQANCTDSSGAPTSCAPIAQTTGTSFPWAIRSANLTYVGEVPFSYMSEADRYVAFSDLLFPALAPSAQPSHRALVRLEDVSPVSDPTVLRQVADYLSSQNVPFSVNVIPEYTDPNGYYNNGTPQTVTLAQAPSVVSALKYMQSKGGTLNDEGYTHQYSNVANPYDGVSGDDAEFFRAQCSTTQSPPYNFDSPCQNTDSVVWTGPLPGDSQIWAAGRALTGKTLFTLAGLAAPSVWVTPHYFASAADYAGIDSVYSTRYEREIFASGQLSGQTLDYTRIFGQFFPYVVHDVYGEKVIPENLGDDEPTAMNNNPPRTPADIVHNAQVNLAVTQGVASFFFDPDNPLSDLQQIVSGIKNLGYTFVSTAGIG
ncbi:MAG TPA: DUF2334 domain-containing protein [Streptosporangiaceae bacterium]|jgi:uncharacterized protein YdaL|nr:DUF2334 domain-containing protein [Streptosporangiaceae bacterium]